MDGYADLLGEDTTVIAHSLAPAFVCDWFASNDKCSNHFVAVAPFYGLIGIEEFDEVNQTFFVDKEKIKAASKKFKRVSCVFSDNDPYVPLALSEEFTRLSAGNKIVIPGGGHLNSSAGYDQFTELLDVIT